MTTFAFDETGLDFGTRQKLVRQIIIEGDVAYIPLTNGHMAIIDASDAGIVEGFNWNAHKMGRSVYAKRHATINGAHITLYLHRAILDAPANLLVDHINGNGLDNRRANLRLATRAQNTRNRGAQTNNKSGIKGIYFHKAAQKWSAEFSIDRQKTYLGLFRTKAEALSAYRQKLAEIGEEFTRI